MAELGIYHLLDEGQYWKREFTQKRQLEYVNRLIRVVGELCTENKQLRDAVRGLQNQLEKLEGRLGKKVERDEVDRRMSSVNERLQQLNADIGDLTISKVPEPSEEGRLRDLDIDLLEKVIRMAKRKGWDNE